MGAKGDRGAKEPLAKRLYGEGISIPDISRQLETTLRKWKSETTPHGGGTDDWDRCRQQKRSNIQRMKDLFEREFTFAEESAPGSIPQASLNALNNLGSLVKRWEEVERASGGPAYDKPKVFLDNLEFIARQLQSTDPEGLKVLARNFDLLVMSFKAEHA